MSSISQKKEEIREKREKDKKNSAPDWKGFGFSVLFSFIRIIILTFVSSSLIYSIQNFSRGNVIPSDIGKPPYKTGYEFVGNRRIFTEASFPYNLRENADGGVISKWFGSTMAGSWSMARHILKQLLGSLNGGFSMLNKYNLGIRDPKTLKMVRQGITNMISFIYILGSTLIIPVLMIVTSIVGFIGTFYAGIENADGLIQQVIALAAMFFMALPIAFMSMMQGGMALLTILFKPFLTDARHVLKFFKSFQAFFGLIFVAMIISAAVEHKIGAGPIIGIVLGLVLLYGMTFIRDVVGF
jgi:hypothetical protein